jgi:serine/threonine protein kinase
MSMLPVAIGRYRVVRRLGGGGMGEVYLARDSQLYDRHVAVKVPRFDVPELRESLRQRFLREAAVAAKVPHHAHLCPVYDYGECDGRPFLVMAFVEGGSLADRLRTRGRFEDVREGVRLARQAAEGLAALHGAGVVHRDVKPANILLNSNGEPLLSDFGLARSGNGAGMTGAGVVVGTFGYMAPEQADGQATQITGAADVYSLGVVLHVLLTGQLPSRDGVAQAASAAGGTDAPPPAPLRPDMDSALEGMLWQMMAWRPEDRPPAAALAMSLGWWLDGANGFASKPTVADSAPASSLNTPQPVPRHRRLRLVAPILGLPILLALLWRVASGGGSNAHPDASPLNAATAVSPGAAVQPLQVQDLSVKLFTTRKDKTLQFRGTLGKDCYETHQNDSVTLESRLSRPGYAFLIAFRTDGVDEVCFPEKDDEPPTRTDRPRFPLTSKAGDYGLDEGEGLQAFAVVASDEPLPVYKQWKAELGNPPWGRFTTAAGVVWRGDGADLDALTASPGALRGKEHVVPGRSHISQLVTWLRHDRRVQSVVVVGFAVLPKVER